MKSIDPRLHAAVVSYFGGIARHTQDRILQDHIIENAEKGDYDTAHKLSLEYRLLDPKSPYARTDHFPLEQFYRFDALKNQEENGATKSMKPRTHAGARSVSINNRQWKKIAEEKWSKLDNHAINEIVSAVAEHGFDNDEKGGPLDVSHLVQYAREKTSKSMYNLRNNSLRLLQFGLSKHIASLDPLKKSSSEMMPANPSIRAKQTPTRDSAWWLKQMVGCRKDYEKTGQMRRSERMKARIAHTAKDLPQRDVLQVAHELGGLHEIFPMGTLHLAPDWALSHLSPRFERHPHVLDQIPSNIESVSYPENSLHAQHHRGASYQVKKRIGLSKASIRGLEGINRNPEAQRKQDMDTGFFRKPKTYQGTHPHHDVIYSYFNHFSRKLDDDAKATILHDARLGEYGSAQRKLARRNDKLPAGLDGLKFGDLQINMIKEMREEGIL